MPPSGWAVNWWRGTLSGLLLCLASWAPALAGPGSTADIDVARADLQRLSQAFRTVYQQVLPAVVLITTSARWEAMHQRLPAPEPPVPEVEPKGLGSGIVVSPDGYILSNHHLVAGADSIRITLADRRAFQATVVGHDSLIDVALLKIDAEQLPVARLGRAANLQIGDWVLAIGHPLGMGTTLTHGIVSALGRRASIIDDAYGVESFIQTNAVINPGNSGGPLLNLAGEVVGINTAISTRTGYYMGYGLAVPVELAQEAMEDIRTHGRVVRGYLGVSMSEVTPDLIRARGLDMDRPRGVYLAVLPGSPAERSGLQDDDVLIRVNGQEVDRPNQVQAMVYHMDPGETVALTVLRGGVGRVLDVSLGEREADRRAALGRDRLSGLGFSVQPLSGSKAGELGFTNQVAEELGYEAGEPAVRVDGVDPAGLAGIRGLQVDDVVTHVDDELITSVPTLLTALAGVEAGEAVVLWLWRPGLGVDVRVLPVEK